MADAAFWDRIADRYAARSLGDEAAYAATLERARAHLRPADTALEIGCGTGRTAIALAPSVASYHATDLAPRMIEIARSRPEGAAAANLSFSVAEATEAPEAPGAVYDAVLAFNLLHLLDDLPAGLREIAAHLRPGGRLISKTPCLRDLSLPVRLPVGLLVRPMRLAGLAPALRFLGARELERSIAEAGFRIVETGDFPARRAQRLVVAERA